MTKEEFDNYRFSIKTEIYFYEWDKITEIDFENRKIKLSKGPYIDYSKVQNIKERA